MYIRRGIHGVQMASTIGEQTNTFIMSCRTTGATGALDTTHLAVNEHY